jgi:hypothetical protein
MLPEAMQRRYVMLLCLRCSEVLETLHETEIAFQLRLDEAQLLETKQLFISKNFIDKHWNILNWDKRQFVSDSSTMRVRKYRDKKKLPSNDDETLQKRPSNAIDTEADTDKKQNSKRGSRLANDWVLPNEWEYWSNKERPDLNAMQVADQFKDFWCAKPGKDGVKLDWAATWRNWVRNQKAPKINPADIVRVTVAPSNLPDPALEKIKQDEKVTRPPTPEERAILNAYRRKA